MLIPEYSNILDERFPDEVLLKKKNGIQITNSFMDQCCIGNRLVFDVSMDRVRSELSMLKREMSSLQ
jgi:hypothetical protein